MCGRVRGRQASPLERAGEHHTRPRGAHRAGARPVAHEAQDGVLARQPPPRAHQDVHALVVLGPPHEQHDRQVGRKAGLLPPLPLLVQGHHAPEDLGLDGLGRNEDALRALAIARHVARDVRPVGHDRVRPAVDAAHEAQRKGMRDREGMAPEGRPEHERRPGPAGAPIRGRQRDPAGDHRDHRRVASRKRRGVALVREPVRRERRLLDLPVEVPERLGDVVRFASEAVQLDAVPLVQQAIERQAVRRQVVGDERDRHTLRLMNVLLLHNRYREPGGEERSLAAIATLLEARGHDVAVLERTSASLTGSRGRLRAGAAMLAGGLDPDAVASAVRRHRAAILHAHNINPLFGARALRAARKAGARVVLHVHNYRLVCAIAVEFRDGQVCTRCRGRNTWPSVRLRCRGNLPEAAAYSAGIALHQRSVLDAVDRCIVPSDAISVARRKTTAAGKRRIFILVGASGLEPLTPTV